MKSGRFRERSVRWTFTGLCVIGFVVAAMRAVALQGVPGTEAAGWVFDRMFPTELTPVQRAFVHKALRDARGFAVLPNMTKTGIGVSQFQGRGLLVYRDADGAWRPPLPLVVSGTSVGPHYGMVSFDTLAVIRTPEALQRLLAGKITPTGRESTAAPGESALEKEEIIAYTRARGLSGGCSQDDIHIDLDVEAYAAKYGARTAPRTFFEGGIDTCRMPLPAQKLAEEANVRSGGAPLTTIWVMPVDGAP